MNLRGASSAIAGAAFRPIAASLPMPSRSLKPKLACRGMKSSLRFSLSPAVIAGCGSSDVGKGAPPPGARPLCPRRASPCCRLKTGAATRRTPTSPTACRTRLTTDLAKIADLKVISRTSVYAIKPARRVICVRSVSSSVWRMLSKAACSARHNKVRVNAQLIDARHRRASVGANLRSRSGRCRSRIQSEIAKAIADQLQAKLSPNEKKAIEQPPTTDLAAFDLYSRAKSLLLTASFSATSEPDTAEGN